MTTFKSLNVRSVGAPDGAATAASVDVSGTAVFSMSGLTVVDAETTVAATGTSAVIPGSAEAFLEVNVNGTLYVVPLFLKA